MGLGVNNVAFWIRGWMELNTNNLNILQFAGHEAGNGVDRVTWEIKILYWFNRSNHSQHSA